MGLRRRRLLRRPALSAPALALCLVAAAPAPAAEGPLGSPFGLSPAAGVAEGDPQLIAAPGLDGGYVGAWRAQLEEGNPFDGAFGSGVVVQRLTELGEQEGVAHLSPDTSVFQTVRGTPSVAYAPAHGVYLVVWASTPSGLELDEDLEIHAWRLDEHLDPLGPVTDLTATGAEGQTEFFATEPSVAYDPAIDRFVVVFARTRPVDASDSELAAVTVPPAGGVASTPTPITPPANTKSRPAGPRVVMTPEGGLVAYWTHETATVRIQRLDGGGPDGPSAEVSGGAPGTRPAIAWSPVDQRALVAWENDHAVLARVFGPAATPLSGAATLDVVEQPGGTGRAVAIAANTRRGGFGVAWTGVGDGQQGRPRVRLVGPAGTPTSPAYDAGGPGLPGGDLVPGHWPISLAYSDARDELLAGWIGFGADALSSPFARRVGLPAPALPDVAQEPPAPVVPPPSSSAAAGSIGQGSAAAPSPAGPPPAAKPAARVVKPAFVIWPTRTLCARNGRTVTLRFRAQSAKLRLTSVRVTGAGKRARTVRGAALRRALKLTVARRGATIRVASVASDRRTRVERRRYAGCPRP